MAARLNKKERIVILVGILVLALMCLIPPWQSSSSYAGITWWDGPRYWPIFLRLPGSEPGRIDLVRLTVQCAVVVLGTAGVVWFMRLWRKDQTAEKTS